MHCRAGSLVGRPVKLMTISALGAVQDLASSALFRECSHLKLYCLRTFRKYLDFKIAHLRCHVSAVSKALRLEVSAVLEAQ